MNDRGGMFEKSKIKVDRGADNHVDIDVRIESFGVKEHLEMFNDKVTTFQERSSISGLFLKNVHDLT